MFIEFFTKNIDEEFYNKAINQIFERWGLPDEIIERWHVKIFPVTSSENNPEYYKNLVDYPTSSKMAWGHTGKYQITCFLIDSSDYRTALLSNFVVISHEIAHAVLYSIFGGISKIYVGEVHNIYYKNPKYLSIQVDNVIIRILDITSSMEKTRMCEISFSEFVKMQYQLNAYAILYYFNLDIKTRLLE